MSTKTPDKRLKKTIDDLDLRNIHIGIFDLDGAFRHKLVSAEKAAKLAEGGYSFCDVLYAWDSAEKPYDEDGAYSDRPCFIDGDSLRSHPFRDHDGVVIADFAGEFGEKSPRNQLLRMLKKAEGMGFDVLSAFEFEFFVFNETPDTLRAKEFRNLDHFAKANRTYSLQTALVHDDIFADLPSTMARMGVELDSIHTEFGPGCFEAPLKAERGIRAADNAALFKNFAKAFFLRRNLTAAFMSKLTPDLPGQSGHLHISLRDRDDRPVFHESDGPDCLSRTARHFIGGVVKLLPEMVALCSHTINAYKRMVPGMWAPTASTWGVQDRAAAIRVINGRPNETRVEFRVPSSDTNPHAALALTLGAGLWGIENAVEPPDPGVSAGSFPRDLAEATERLDRSEVARAMFGNAFIDHFVLSRRKEVDAFRRHVTEWEIRRYIELA